MRAWKWLVASLLAAGLATAQPPANPAPPGSTTTPEAGAVDWTERLFWNARERTAASRRAFEEGDLQAAVEPARAAHRLAPDDPVTGLNLGSALLGAGQAQEALPLLDEATEALEERYTRDPSEAQARLVAGAHYNQGNAHLAAGDLEGAIRSYEQALRRSPQHQDAKFNLELALREQQRQQQQREQDGQGEDGSENPDGGDESQGDSPQQPESGEAPGDAPEGTGDDGREKPQQPDADSDPTPPQPPDTPSEDGRPEPSPLPQFEDQPDMTAEEAAAILEAVENREKEQREDEARRRALQRPAKEKDW